MEITGKELLEYACGRFEEGAYEEALEAFVLAYMKGFEQEWILENIYQCYVDGNDAEYRKAYNKQSYKLDCEYDECILDFIPYMEGVYFVFDKKAKVFLGKFSAQELREMPPEPSFSGMEFSAAALEFDWNWGEFKTILAEAKNREIYAVSHDLKRAASFCKIPELEEYMDHVRMFPGRVEFQTYFHENTAVYMPLLVSGSKSDTEELNRILKEEHQYRLTPEGRNTENVLLTIGIPTHDRGNLLLKRLKNLQKMPYDAEIEIAISKNGTHYYQEEYESVKDIEDARINYVGYDKELVISENWQNVIHIACGSFVLMVSDEDDVILEALEHYLNLLHKHREIGMVRSKTMVQYSPISEYRYFKKGKAAFLGGFLRQNYLSGTIYNRKLFLETHMERWDKKYQNNEFYYRYPHMWWQVTLAFKGDYVEDTTCLIWERESMYLKETLKRTEEDASYSEGADRDCPSIQTVSTYSARVEQFREAVELIREFSEFDEEMCAGAFFTLIRKTLYLMELIRDVYHYKEEEFPEWVERLVKEVIVSLEKLNIDASYKKIILSQSLKIALELYKK